MTDDDDGKTRGQRAIEGAWDVIHEQEQREAAEKRIFDSQRELIDRASVTQRASSALLAAATLWNASVNAGFGISEDRVLETADRFLDWLKTVDLDSRVDEVKAAIAVSGPEDSATNVARAPDGAGEEDPTSSVLPTDPEFREGDFLQDSNGLVWKVVRDGGMVERDNIQAESGKTSAGIAWLRATAGPLTKLRS